MLAVTARVTVVAGQRVLPVDPGPQANLTAITTVDRVDLEELRMGRVRGW